VNANAHAFISPFDARRREPRIVLVFRVGEPQAHSAELLATVLSGIDDTGDLFVRNPLERTFSITY